jgi:hypothetical protein
MDYYEKCCQYQNIDYRYLIIYIHTISNTSSFEINWVFFVEGQNYPPFKNTGLGACFSLPPTPPAVTNLFSRAFQQHKSIGSGKCNKVFTTQCLALNKVKRQDIRFTKQISVTRISNLPSKFHVLLIF